METEAQRVRRRMQQAQAVENAKIAQKVEDARKRMEASEKAAKGWRSRLGRSK